MAGFTLLEVLVALSMVAIGLASIGALVASNVRGVNSIEGHLTRLETARALLTELPDRDQIAPGTFVGETGDHRWRIDVSPLATTGLALQPDARWQANVVVLTVSSPRAGEMQIATIRLQPSNAR